MTTHSQRKGKDQEKHNQTTPLATSKTSRIINHTNEPEPPTLKPLRCPILYDDGHGAVLSDIQQVFGVMHFIVLIRWRGDWLNAFVGRSVL